MGRMVINQAFRNQQVTGQQRYATELAGALAQGQQRRDLMIPRVFEGNRWSEWLWAVHGVHRLEADEYLLSFTSRAPIWHRRHIITVHDLFVLTNPEWYSKGYVGTHAPLLRQQLRTCAACIAVSKPTLELLDDFLPASTPRVLAPNGWSASLVVDGGTDGDGRGILGRLGIEPKKYLLTVGSLDPRKNFSRLAAAYAQLPRETRAKYPLVIVGGQSKVFAFQNVSWPEECRHAGYVSDGELAILYRESRGVVLPSLAEGFGLPVIEAAANAVPLAISDLPVFRWIYGPGAHYFDPTNAADISRSLAELVSTDPSRSFLNKKARLIREQFSWDSSARAVGELVDSL